MIDDEEYPDVDRMHRALCRMGIVNEDDEVPDDEIVEMYRSLPRPVCGCHSTTRPSS